NDERGAENARREEENKTRSAAGQPLLPMLTQLALGTGINSGTMTVGLMGSDAHILNYTVFGREVNLASRLESVSGRSRIIVGQETYAELRRHTPDLAAVCVLQEPVTVKGFRQPVQVYEVPWRQG
ncbi:MAG TPA: adenylate/guanylate cyclase domain-containing protein, partial [Candidatus Limnocylindria bacterium]|nr:adenylate/guanylate cyclase domain-containing protein [Candidatus Limnocylindria bacterium]